MKNRGFTLIELLAIIAILAVILLIAVPYILNVLNNVSQKAYDENKDMMDRASKIYLSTHQDLLPTTVGNYITIPLSTLITGKYIGEIVDPKTKNNCDSASSNVKVTKTATGYDYEVTLTCDSYGSEYVDANDNINPTLAVKQDLNDVGVYGFDDNYMFFDNNNDNINIPYNAALAPTTAITFSFWLYSADWSKLQGDDTLISKTETGGYNCSMDATTNSHGDGDIECLIRRNGAYAAIATSYLNFAPGWHLITATYDGRYSNFYVDNILKDTNDAGASYPIQYSFTNNLFIGAEAYQTTNPSGTDWFGGILSDVRIYNTSLTAGQVGVIYNDNRQDNNPGLADFSSGLVGY